MLLSYLRHVSKVCHNRHECRSSFQLKCFYHHIPSQDDKRQRLSPWIAITKEEGLGGTHCREVYYCPRSADDIRLWRRRKNTFRQASTMTFAGLLKTFLQKKRTELSICQKLIWNIIWNKHRQPKSSADLSITRHATHQRQRLSTVNDREISAQTWHPKTWQHSGRLLIPN